MRGGESGFVVSEQPAAGCGFMGGGFSGGTFGAAEMNLTSLRSRAVAVFLRSSKSRRAGVSPRRSAAWMCQSSDESLGPQSSCPMSGGEAAVYALTSHVLKSVAGAAA